MNRKNIVIAIVVFQVAIIVVMVLRSLLPLLTGKPVVLAVFPRDPRDIFRGNYVALNYEFSTIEKDKIDVDTAHTYHFGDELYLWLKPNGKFYVAEKISNKKPDNDQLYLLAIVQNQYKYSNEYYYNYLNVKCGIESYFTTKEKAKQIENLLVGFVPDELQAITETNDSLKVTTDSTEIKKDSTDIATADTLNTDMNAETRTQQQPQRDTVRVTVMVDKNGRARIKQLEWKNIVF